MIVNGQALRPLRAESQRRAVVVIDQRLLPHRLHTERLQSVADVVTAIRDMCARRAVDRRHRCVWPGAAMQCRRL